MDDPQVDAEFDMDSHYIQVQGVLNTLTTAVVTQPTLIRACGLKRKKMPLEKIKRPLAVNSLGSFSSKSNLSLASGQAPVGRAQGNNMGQEQVQGNNMGHAQGKMNVGKEQVPGMNVGQEPVPGMNVGQEPVQGMGRGQDDMEPLERTKDEMFALFGDNDEENNQEVSTKVIVNEPYLVIKWSAQKSL